ncbi:calponin homology domain-containing protein DDB_G0272472-like [Watersipora subatra]|uniref:calponin homology domain-containing protein DDB_G0272472-like n=1 Tax=Watersipora subatra TaxID=2589382 RepID=UPI00355B26F9
MSDSALNPILLKGQSAEPNMREPKLTHMCFAETNGVCCQLFNNDQKEAMSSPSNIDLVEVTSILKELSSLSKERNNNGTEFIPDRLRQLNGNFDKTMISSDSDSGITAITRDERMSDSETKQAQPPLDLEARNIHSTFSMKDFHKKTETKDVEMTHGASLDPSIDPLDDELASRVEKSLADMQDLLDHVEEELDLSEDLDEGHNHYTEDAGAFAEGSSQEDIIDLTLTGLKREIIEEEFEEVDSVGSESHNNNGSIVSYGSEHELNVGDSAAACRLLEQKLRLERSELMGETDTSTPCPPTAERGGSNASSSESGDDLHKQVELSLAGSVTSLEQTVIAAEEGSEHSDGYASTIQGMNSRDELEIYDSRDAQKGTDSLMNELPASRERPVSKTPPSAHSVPAIFTINQLKRKFDSVDNIMDRIDEGISTLRTVEVPVRECTAEDVDQPESKMAEADSVATKSSEFTKAPQLTDNMKHISAQPYSKSAPNIDMAWLSSQSYSKPSFMQGEREESDGMPFSEDDISAQANYDEDNMADEDSMGLSGGENLSDLDSDAASATNAKFSEILRSKQNSLDHSLRSLQAHSVAESTDTPLTEDFEERFKTSIKYSQIPLPDPQKRPTTQIYNLPKARPSSVNRDGRVSKRRSPTTAKRSQTPPKPAATTKSLAYSGMLKKELDMQRVADTLDELSDIEPEVRTRKRPTSPHHAAPIISNGHYEADTESEDGEFAQQIREQSSRIQKEIELERRLKVRQAQRLAPGYPQLKEFPAAEQVGYNGLESRQPSLTRHRGSASHSNLSSVQDVHAFHAYSASNPDISSILAAQQQNTDLLKSQLKEDSHTIKRLSDDRMQLMHEISRLQEELKSCEEEVKSTEQKAKDNRAKAEESRSQLMVSEFKKEAVLKELSRLSMEVEQGKRIIEEAQEKKQQEDKILSSLGLAIQQVPAIVEEREEQRQKLEKMERAAENEKDERSKQVESIKMEAATMQENLQEKIDTLRDSVQRLNAQLERVTAEKAEFKMERDAAIIKCDSLQRDMTAGEQAKAQALEQTIKGYDDMRRRLEKESAETRSQLSNELAGVQKLLEIEEQKGAKLREEIELRDQLNESLREQLSNYRQRSTDEEDAHEKLVRDLKQQLRDCDNERLAAWDSCKQQFEVEKDKLLEMVRDDLERQHSELLSAVREEHSRQVSQLQHANKNKESESYMLRERLSQQEQESKKTVEALKADTRQQVKDAVQSEKKIWEKEQKYLENEQLKQFREKEENQLEQLRLQLEAERRRKAQVEESLNTVRAELEESALYNQKINQEKLAAAQKLKQAEDNQAAEMSKLKKELKQHYDKMMAALREEVEEKDQEIERLRQENSAVVQSEAESSQALEKFERIMIHEINEECKKTADLLGVQPRRAQTVSFSRSSSPSKSRSRKRSTSRSVTASAVANLRACNEELRNSLAELKSEVTALSSTVHRSEKAKELELEQLRNKLSNEKRQEVEDMRMSLAKMPACRRSLTEPQDSYQLKVDRKASEKALRKSLTGSYSALNGSSPEYASTQKVEDLRESISSQSLHSVQDRLRHMRAGSPLRYSSNPTLTHTGDSTKYSSSHSLSTAGVESLEQKVRLAELKARLADERANRNQAILSQKMQEVNELQHTINSQTKEMMGLERSYDDLKSAQYSPNRYSMLNNTFPH